MRNPAPTLTPLLRSDAQGRLLGELFTHPEQESTISDLAARTGDALATVQREVTRLAEAGYVRTRKVGPARLVRVETEHPLYDPVSRLVMATYGPLPALCAALAPIDGVEAAFVFGSWAARMEGEPGPFPADVDVLVVGTVSRLDVFEPVADVEREVGRPVNATVVAPERWSHGDDGFVESVRSRPKVRIPLEECR